MTHSATRFSHFIAQLIAAAVVSEQTTDAAANVFLQVFFSRMENSALDQIDELRETYQRSVASGGLGAGSYITPHSVRIIVDGLKAVLPSIGWERLAVPAYKNRASARIRGEESRADICLRGVGGVWFSAES